MDLEESDQNSNIINSSEGVANQHHQVHQEQQQQNPEYQLFIQQQHYAYTNEQQQQGNISFESVRMDYSYPLYNNTTCTSTSYLTNEISEDATAMRKQWQEIVQDTYGLRKKQLDAFLSSPNTECSLMDMVRQNGNCLREFLYQWSKAQKIASVDTMATQKKHNERLFDLDQKFEIFYGQLHFANALTIGENQQEIFNEFVNTFFENSTIFSQQPPAYIICEKNCADEETEWLKSAISKSKKLNNTFDIELRILGFLRSFHETFYVKQIGFDLIIEQGTEVKDFVGERKFILDGPKNLEQKYFSQSCCFKIVHELIGPFQCKIGIEKLNQKPRRLTFPCYNILCTIVLELKKDFLFWNKGDLKEFQIVSLPFGILTAARKKSLIIANVEKKSVKEADADYNILRYFGSIKLPFAKVFFETEEEMSILQKSNYSCSFCQIRVSEYEITRHLKCVHHLEVIDGRRISLLNGWTSFDQLYHKAVYSEKLVQFLEAIFLSLIEDHGQETTSRQDRRFSQSAIKCLLYNYFSSEISQKMQIKSIIEVKLSEDALLLLKRMQRFKNIHKEANMNYVFYRLYREFAIWIGEKCHSMWSNGFLYGFCGQAEAEHILKKYYLETGQLAMMIRCSGKTPGVLIASVTPGIIHAEKDNSHVITNHFCEHYHTLSDQELAKILKFSTNYISIHTVACCNSFDGIVFVPKKSIYMNVLENKNDDDDWTKKDYFKYHELGGMG